MQQKGSSLQRIAHGAQSQRGPSAAAPAPAKRSHWRPAPAGAPGRNGTAQPRSPSSSTRASPGLPQARRSGSPAPAEWGRVGCASQGRAESIGRHRRRQSAGRPGSEAQRNFGDLQCPARVSDSNSSLTGRRMLWVRLHVLKSVMLIFLIFTNAISEVLLR